MNDSINNIDINSNDISLSENGQDKVLQPNQTLLVSNELQAFGAEQSAKVSGNPQVLNTHFEWFFQDALRNANGKNYEQQKKIDDLNKEITGLESNNDKLANDIKDIDSKIVAVEKDIAQNRAKENHDINDKKSLINQKQIERCKQKILNERLSNQCSCFCANVLDLTPTVGIYDRIWSEDAFSHIPNKKKLMKTCFNLLDMNGLLVFSDLVKISSLIFVMMGLFIRFSNAIKSSSVRFLPCTI